MKIFFIGLICIPLLIASTTISNVEQASMEDSDPSIYKLMEVISLWSLLKHEYEPNKAEDGTWLDVGFRSKYAMAKKYASLNVIEAAFGAPVFLKGPHSEGMNFNSTTSFGYYNPDFISKLKSSIASALESPMFNMMIKKAYKQHFESMAVSYKDAYLFINSDPDKIKMLKEQYQSQLAQEGGTTEGSLQEEFRSYADGEYFSVYAQGKAGEIEVDIYERATAPAFWVRRSIDGTSKELFELLDMLMVEMDK
jgi:hypothetical protein